MRSRQTSSFNIVLKNGEVKRASAVKDKNRLSHKEIYLLGVSKLEEK